MIGKALENWEELYKTCKSSRKVWRNSRKLDKRLEKFGSLKELEKNSINVRKTLEN